jgi:hypothetical protein
VTRLVEGRGFEPIRRISAEYVTEYEAATGNKV